MKLCRIVKSSPKFVVFFLNEFKLYIISLKTMKGPKAQKLYDMLKFSQLRLMHEQILHSHLICHACYIIIPTIYLFLMFFFLTNILIFCT